MKAVILAAGRGSRMGHFTDNICKPMLVLKNGKPILENILESLPEQISEVIIIVGYKGEYIRGYFGNSFGKRVIKYKEQNLQDEDLKGSWPALCLAKEELLESWGEKFLMLNADDIFDKESLERLVENDNAILVGEVENISDAKRFGVVSVEDGVMTEIVEKPEYPKSTTVSAGAFVFENSIFSYPNPAKRNNGEMLVPDVVRGYSQDRKFNTVFVKKWRSIGTEEEYREELSNILETKKEAGDELEK